MSTINVKDTKPIVIEDDEPKKKFDFKPTGIDRILHGNLL